MFFIVFPCFSPIFPPFFPSFPPLFHPLGLHGLLKPQGLLRRLRRQAAPFGLLASPKKTTKRKMFVLVRFLEFRERVEISHFIRFFTHFSQLPTSFRFGLLPFLPRPSRSAWSTVAMRRLGSFSRASQASPRRFRAFCCAKTAERTAKPRVGFGLLRFGGAFWWVEVG